MSFYTCGYIISPQEVRGQSPSSAEDYCMPLCLSPYITQADGACQGFHPRVSHVFGPCIHTEKQAYMHRSSLCAAGALKTSLWRRGPSEPGPGVHRDVCWAPPSPPSPPSFFVARFPPPHHLFVARRELLLLPPLNPFYPDDL